MNRFYHLVFFNHYFVSQVVKDLFVKKKFYFLKSNLNFVYLKNKIVSKFKYMNIFIFFNDFFYLHRDDKFFRDLGSFLKKYHNIIQKKFIKFFLKFLYNLFYRLPNIFTLKKLITGKIKKLLCPETQLEINFLIYKQNFVDIRSIGRIAFDILSNQRRSLWAATRIISRVLTAMFRRGEIKGFKFLFVGRFSRRNRASYKWKLVGRLPLNSRNERIDYISVPLVLKYGACTSHIWVNY